MKIKPHATRTIVILVVFLLAIYLASHYWRWQRNYSDRVYPGVTLSDINLSGLTAATTQERIRQAAQSLESKGITIKHGEKTATLLAQTASFDADLSRSTFLIDYEATTQVALGNKRQRSFGYYLLTRFKSKTDRQIKAVYTLNEEGVHSFLQENFTELNIAPENAYFSVISGTDESAQLKNNPEKVGKEINYGKFFIDLINNLNNLHSDTITLTTQSKYPSVRQSDLAVLEPDAKKIITQGGLTLNFNEKNNDKTSVQYWEVGVNKLITWVSVKNDTGKLSLALDLEKIKSYLENTIAPKVDLEVIQPKFEIKDNKVTSWQKGVDGRQVDLEASANKINTEFLAGQNQIELIVIPINSETSTNGENFKIEEIIGTGYSSFVGSPANRRENIRVGAARLHGILIKPGEEFSLIKTLGDVSKETGYLPELVIKGNKTVPEYGGGLCQIGTTVFRTALASGLPITMRQNHSYRVAYYEPAGTDATIYIPWPDLRFMNDTGNYILIQARIIKNDLYFDFWGIKDGRIISTTTPTIYNIVKPEPTKTVETDDLKPGEKKCTESSHNGADAYFDYKVVYPEGSTTTPIQERRFTSHYVPWQAVCLVGRATSTATSTIITDASSTPIVNAASSPN